MSNQNENVELETTEIEHYIDMGQALDRLKDNPDFKKVILDGYFKDKALDSVSLLSVPAIKKRGERGDIMEDLVAISNLQFFFMTIDQMHRAAAEPILSDAEEAELAAAEESENGAH
ncbi:MAG: hypothetical protein PF450_02250 [Bacteroidales bacterium]|jgi:uncharacterized protein (UPF0264 family)|nr:hypothetical protein [Bacteroidales bacterium]